MESQECNKCNQTLPLNMFTTSNRTKSGRVKTCKPCCNEKARKDYASDIELSRAKKNAYQQKWNEKNREWKNERAKLWSKRNPGRCSEYTLAWQEKNKEKHRQYRVEYERKAKSVSNARCARRKAAKIQRTPDWLTDDHHFLISEIYKASQERSDMTGVPHHVDHIVPLRGKKVSGLHVPWNLQVITASENLSKLNKWEI